jgi:hypothetical protein
MHTSPMMFGTFADIFDYLFPGFVGSLFLLPHFASLGDILQHFEQFIDSGHCLVY